MRAKAAGKIVALYKVVGQRQVLIIVDAESHEEIDRSLMATLPMAPYEELEEILPIWEYESFADDVKRRWKCVLGTCGDLGCAKRVLIQGRGGSTFVVLRHLPCKNMC